MNKMLVVVFDNDASAEAGVQALRKLHDAGDITLYATGVLAKDAQGKVSVKKSMGLGSGGTITGLAVGSLMGLLAGPGGVAVGAVTGTVIGAIRDFWVAGVGLDFIEEVEGHLASGKVAVVAEVEEEWMAPVDAALQSAGGQVFRRSRAEVAEVQFNHDIATIKSEITELESEVAHTSGAVNAKLQDTLATTRDRLDSAVQGAKQRVETLKQEADGKAESLRQQLSHASSEVKEKIEQRMHRVKGAYQARGAKLAQAWILTKEAFTG